MVSETMRPLAVEHLAGMPSFVAGVAIVRGVPTPVIDAGRLLGIADAPRASRFVALRVGDRRAVMAVDAVLGVRSLLPEALEELPPLLRDASSDVIARIGTLDADLLVVLTCAKLVPPGVWALLDGGDAPS
jgi:purine-binding chemotaxis protein CheW